jgi:hypothetical protein
MTTKITFTAWMSQVDEDLWELAALVSGDLPDWDYREAYDDGEDSLNVARAVLADNGFDAVC